MQEAHRTRVVPFPSTPPEPLRPRPECRISFSPTTPTLTSRPELAQRCAQLIKAFEKKWGFELPVLIFEEDGELPEHSWTLSMRGCEVHQGKLVGDPLESITSELLARPGKFFTYETFRMRLKELEEWEPYLAQEVAGRLDLVLIWQALQSLLKTGGSLHRFSSKMERLLVEADGRSRDHILSPRMLSSLQQC